jgi:hypothetical protein
MFVLPLQSNRILQGVLLPTLRPYGTFYIMETGPLKLF